MTELTHSRLLILGSGPAGYTAAIYAARQSQALAGHRACARWPAHDHHRSGQLAGRRDGRAGARADGKVSAACRTLRDAARSGFDRTRGPLAKPFRLRGEEAEYTCDALFIATGASAKYLGLPSEAAFMGRGVSACATCDGFFHRGQDVCVVGGGNSAVEQALYLSNIARKVHLIHRRDSFRAEPIMVDKLYVRVAEGKIQLHLSQQLDEVLGDARGVTGLRIKGSDGETQQLDLHGCFIAIGHQPNTSLFEDQLDMLDGYLITRGGQDGFATMTSVDGVFAAGDVQDHVYRQAITSAGTGCMAALDAQRFLGA